jgi:hypothetical protein
MAIEQVAVYEAANTAHLVYVRSAIAVTCHQHNLTMPW